MFSDTTEHVPVEQMEQQTNEYYLHKTEADNTQPSILQEALLVGKQNRMDILRNVVTNKLENIEEIQHLIDNKTGELDLLEQNICNLACQLCSSPQPSAQETSLLRQLLPLQQNLMKIKGNRIKLIGACQLGLDSTLQRVRTVFGAISLPTEKLSQKQQIMADYEMFQGLAAWISRESKPARKNLLRELFWRNTITRGMAFLHNISQTPEEDLPDNINKYIFRSLPEITNRELKILLNSLSSEKENQEDEEQILVRSTQIAQALKDMLMKVRHQSDENQGTENTNKRGQYSDNVVSYQCTCNYEKNSQGKHQIKVYRCQDVPGYPTYKMEITGLSTKPIITFEKQAKIKQNADSNMTTIQAVNTTTVPMYSLIQNYNMVQFLKGTTKCNETFVSVLTFTNGIQILANPKDERIPTEEGYANITSFQSFDNNKTSNWMRITFAQDKSNVMAQFLAKATVTLIARLIQQNIPITLADQRIPEDKIAKYVSMEVYEQNLEHPLKKRKMFHP
jgi:hypothetical protein